MGEIWSSDAFVALRAFLAWSWPYIFTVLYFGLAIAASGHVVLYKRDVRAAVAWAGLIWLSPIVGAVAYTMLGINRIRRRASRLRLEDSNSEQLFAEGEAIDAAPIETVNITDDRGFGELQSIIGRVSGRPLTAGNAVTPLVNGDEGYPAMVEAIEGARRTVALCTYIFDHDRAGERFVKALKAAMKRGVEVRVLIDGVGVRYSRPRITGLLRDADVPVAKFLKSMSPVRNPYLNLRNHRKMLVIDGRVGFTGGLNIREGCVLSLDPPHPVQDVHFRFEGPVVRHMVEEFAFDWEFTTDEQLRGDGWFADPPAAGPVAARGVADGPDENFEAIRWGFLGALAAATESVRITTPYFVPDQTLIAALNTAAMRGVSVQIVLPEAGNLRFVQWAATAQLWQVLIHGCEVHLTAPPFDHSKLMLVDDHWAFVGSANWDARSLRLNFEYNVECYDDGLAARIGALIDGKLANSRPLSLDEVNGRPLPIKLRDGVVRLAAPYL